MTLGNSCAPSMDAQKVDCEGKKKAECGKPLPPIATYKSLESATPEDCRIMAEYFNVASTPEKVAERLIKLLESQRGVNLGCEVDLYEHGLQTATRAYNDGADEETIVCALLHDIGELLNPTSHGEVAASLLRPYISAQNYWILMHHEIFQAVYYGEATLKGIEGNKMDPNARERFRDSPYFDACEKFCRDWDQSSFDRTFESKPLSFFKPMLIRILSRKCYSQPGALEEEISVAKKCVIGEVVKEEYQQQSTA